MNSSDKFTFTPNINPTSQLIIGSKYQDSRMNVYERLHNDAKFKKNKKIVLSKENIITGGESRYNTLQRPQSGDFNKNNNRTLSKTIGNNGNIFFFIC